MHQDQAPRRSISGTAHASDRREFLKKTSAVVVIGLAAAAPVAAGLMVVLDPLRRKSKNNGLVRVTSLRALPEDGRPRKFTITLDHVDAWNTIPAVPVGAVYLRRTGPNRVQAFNVVCPHAGCLVDFVSTQLGYLCPCHGSTFGLDGRISDPRSPSPRGLDELEVEIRNQTEVWVQFQNFLTGHPRKVPVA